MAHSRYKVGKFIETWKNGEAQTITFVVTEDCNLRCKYCYISHKSSNQRMDFDVAKKFIDYILTASIKRSEAVIIEFIGGEPFIEVHLIDKITDYFKIRAFELNNEWYWNYRINICTNGVNYSDPEVQKYILKNYDKLSVSITVDGTKEKHDLQRIFPNGEGSYDKIYKNIGLWRSQFNSNTKVTFASEDLCLLKDSIISLWNNGITDIAANVVFENVWKDGDDEIFEQQLKSLADYVLDNQLFDKYYCSLFDESIGRYYAKDDMNRTSCGAGKMMAIDADGKIYPCIRYKSYSLNNKKAWSFGDVENGIDMECVRPFMTATYALQSDEECINCEVASGCNFCQGLNYDEAATTTNFFRAKHICKMHKARVRANEYYFAKLFNKYGIRREDDVREQKRLYFILADDYVDYCAHRNKSQEQVTMSTEKILDGLKYAHRNFFKPIFIHSKASFNFKYLSEYDDYSILHILPAEFYNEAASLKDCLFVFDKENINLPITSLCTCMLNVESSDIGNLYIYIHELLRKANRINLNILDIDRNFDETAYSDQLKEIKDLLIKIYHDSGIIKEVSLVTDLCFINEPQNCKAGDRAFCYAPNGKLYVCPSYYRSNQENDVGDTAQGLSKLLDARLYKRNNSLLCSVCDAFQCTDCIFLNKVATNEVNVSPSFQCRKSHIEREISYQYQIEMNGYATRHKITKLDYKDPMETLFKIANFSEGYYAIAKV